MNITQIMQLAVQHNQAGRLAEADQLYGQVLAQIPTHADALHLRGVLQGRMGRMDLAIELIRKAIGVNPNVAEFHFHLGIALKAGGKLDEAIAAYRRALELDPGHAHAHCNLGVALKAAGRTEEAIAAYRAGLQRCPDFVGLYNNLGAALVDIGQFEEAIACYHRVLRSRGDDASVHTNLANALRSQRKIEEALVRCRRALELQPDYVPGNHTLGLLLYDKGQFDEAITVFRRVIQLKPDYVHAHVNLGAALGEKRQTDEAIAALQQAILLQPDFALAYSNLGTVLRAKRQVDESIAQYQRALELKPDSADVHFNLAMLHRDKGQIEEATASCRASLKLMPDAAESHSTLGILLKDEGRLDEALEAYQRAMELKGDDARIRANFLYTILFHPRFDSAAILREHQEWNRRFGDVLAMHVEPHRNEREANRRLRIGYVSCDFRDHVVGRNMLPLFVNHDRSMFEIHFFSNVTRPDARTAEFGKLCDQWHEIAAINDDELVKLIRNQGIDILVDLTLHMGGNRLLAFARKPAPVQVTFAGYPGTTGLTAIDYRLTDRYLDPPGVGDECYSERSIRLGETFWCYDPLDSSANENDLPAITAGFVTFGCLSNFCKINDEVLDLWAKVLLAVQGSRLLLMTPAGSVWDRLVSRFGDRGISADRLDRVGYQARPDYLQLYHRIDIGLDTFPYNGHSTSLDSYWMGVPVITLPGSTVVGRAGLSQLSNMKLGELIAETPQRFVEIASELAADLPGLKELRSTLRQRMRGSPLMDGRGFARNIESAYRRMWRGWCDGAGLGEPL
jgi:protein O-GlcNAc transferase